MAEQQSWGDSVKNCLGACYRRLLLSGTPLAEERLPYLRSKEFKRANSGKSTKAIFSKALESLSASAFQSTTFLPGSEFSEEELELAAEMREQTGMSHLPIEVVATMFRAFREKMGATVA